MFLLRSFLYANLMILGGSVNSKILICSSFGRSSNSRGALVVFLGAEMVVMLSLLLPKWLGAVGKR